MKFLAKSCFIFMCAYSSSVFSWVTSSDAVIEKIIMHEEGISRDETIIQFKHSSGSFLCHISDIEKNLTSLVLAMYMAKKKVTVHCYDDSKTIGSFTTHKLHRIISN